jgi:hypothetical protein
MIAVPTRSSTSRPTPEELDRLTSYVDDEAVRLLVLDTRNPHGGAGGSLDSEQCAWLVRELARDPQSDVIIATPHRSRDLTNACTAPGAPPRILGAELASLLLVHANVRCWVAGRGHRPSATRHGHPLAGLWEVTPSLLGLDRLEWLEVMKRRATMLDRPPTSSAAKSARLLVPA